MTKGPRRIGTRKRPLFFISVLVLLGMVWSFDINRVAAQPVQENGPSVVHQGDVSLGVRAGMGKLEVSYFAGGWVPFRISVSNQGAPITGRLVVRCPSSDGPTPQFREYIKDIQLPTDSDQFHEISAYISSGEDVQVRLMSADNVVAQTSIKVERTYGFGDQLSVVVVDNDQTALSNISQTSIDKTPNRPSFGKKTPGQDDTPPPQPANPQRRVRGLPFGYSAQSLTVRPSVIPIEDLPRDYISYDQVDAVVLGDAPVSQLNKEQVTALKQWVASGGLVIVTGGADFSGMRSSGLAELLPVEVRGNNSEPSVAQSLSNIYGAFDAGASFLSMSAATRPDSRLLVGNKDQTTVAERSYGSGLVRFIAINPEINPYRAWIGARDLWADLLMPAAQVKPRHTNWITFGRRTPSSTSRFGVQSFLFRLAEIAPPTPTYIILFLISYVLVVGPINYAVLKSKGRTDLSWVTIPAVVLLFTAVSVVVAQRTRGGRSILVDASLVELHQRDGLALVSSGLLMVPSSKGRQEITFGGRATFANDVFQGSQSSSAASSGFEAQRRDEGFTLSVPTTTWTSSLFQVRAMAENLQPVVSVSTGPDNPNDASYSVVRVVNRGQETLTRGVYLSPDAVSEPFDLAAGDEVALKMIPSQTAPFNTWYPSLLTQGSDEADLFQEIEGLLDKEIGGEPVFTKGFFEKLPLSDACKQLEHPVIVCFTEKNPTAIKFNDVFKHRSKAFYVIHL